MVTVGWYRPDQYRRECLGAGRRTGALLRKKNLILFEDEHEVVGGHVAHLRGVEFWARAAIGSVLFAMF